MSVAVLHIDTSDLIRLGVRALAAAGDLPEVLDQVGAVFETATKERISRTKRSPAGKRWQPWSEGYAAYQQASFPNATLLLSGGKKVRGRRTGGGHLRDSITHNVTADGVEVGSNLAYAATHQYGDPRRNIPERPYLGASEQDLDELRDIVDGWLARHLTGGAS